MKVTNQVTYEVKKLTAPMEIDANWNKAQWNNVESVDLNNYMGDIPSFRPSVQAKMMYDNENIYIIFRVADRYVRCVNTQINGPVWEDSCVEIFFSPDIQKPLNYFNVEINCGGTPLVYYNLIPRKDFIRLDVDDIKKIEIASTMPAIIDPEMEEPVIWTLEYRLPSDMLKKYSNITQPEPGVVWRGNFHKCAENNSNPHYVTWAEIDNPTPDFHLPEFFGVLKFI